jgi:hypothetical protein
MLQTNLVLAPDQIIEKLKRYRRSASTTSTTPPMVCPWRSSASPKLFVDEVMPAPPAASRRAALPALADGMTTI